jgi:Fuc2NAc and GlcNAc transferase
MPLVNEVWVVVACVLVIAASMTGIVRKLALAHGILDVPNARSSHQNPTPRGGGVAIVLASIFGWLALAIAGRVPPNLTLALLGGGIAVATVGYLDDRRKLSVWVRLVVHFVAAIWALAWLGGLPDVRVGNQVVSLGVSGDVLATLGIVWALNLFNFMDGIDGIAASEAVFVACAGALVGAVSALAQGTSAAALVFAAACAGFLGWNWPPARIFMGDVGSGFIGYSIAVLAISAARDHSTGLVTWLLLGGVFFIDASVTLVRRLTRHERVHEAHRSHAYQHLARRWGSHRAVTLGVIAIDLLWLLPCALLATSFPEYSLWVLALGLVPLVLLALICGAGRREDPP